MLAVWLAWAVAVARAATKEWELPSIPIGRCHAPAPERGARGLPKHRVAMATIVNNEGRWIPEWIIFHRLLGIDHFYLYDDKSTDDTRDVVRAFDGLGWATLHADIDSIQRTLNIVVPDHVRFTPQFVIVQHAARMYAQDTEWLALFDVDEFLLPRAAAWSCVGDGLSHIENGVGVLRLQGTLFLPNATDSRPLPPSRLLIDNARTFVPLSALHGEDRVPLHKNFARPPAIANFDHHGIHNMQANGMKTHLAKRQQLFFAHFRYRTMSDFAEKKRKAYAGHANKAEVWSRLTRALVAYSRVGVTMPDKHPLNRYKYAVRHFHTVFRKWYARPTPRPPLEIPAMFGRAMAPGNPER